LLCWELQWGEITLAGKSIHCKKGKEKRSHKARSASVRLTARSAELGAPDQTAQIRQRLAEDLLEKIQPK